jgi:hypothetical protein
MDGHSTARGRAGDVKNAPVPERMIRVAGRGWTGVRLGLQRFEEAGGFCIAEAAGADLLIFLAEYWRDLLQAGG